MPQHVVVLGGGLSGLACAYEMVKAGLEVTILEREPDVGGMATSFEVGNRSTAGQPGSDYYSYDFGPHRFHTDEKELIAHVEEVLGPNHVWSKRLSRIYMFGKFFNYPIEFMNVLRSMPWTMIARILFDYGWVRILQKLGVRDYQDRNFKEWVDKRFGETLARIFFVQYTEKAWKMSATEISAGWASQRITLLNLTDTILKTLFKPRNVPRTLVTDFVYPRVGGIGELARGYQRKIEALGGRIITSAPAIRIHREGNEVVRVEYRRGGERHLVEGDQFVSTIPVTSLARSLVPSAPEEVQEAAKSLSHAAIVFVYLHVDKPQVSPDNWVYLPQKELTVHRISEFKNFSAAAAPPDKTLICAEITCRPGDEIWRAKHEKLRDIAVRDLAAIGLLEPGEVAGSFVKRIPFAYPIYDLSYESHLGVVMEFVHGLENLKSGGRQGLFRYNNMDQSIEMGRLMAAALTDQSASDHEGVATGSQYFG